MAEETKKVAEEVAETPKTKKAAKKAEKAPESAAKEFTFRPAIIKDFEILKHLIVTEETQALRDKENALVFAVDKKADKLEIKNAVQAIFGAKVKSVNTINIRRKPRRVGRYSGYLPGYKKAIVRFDSSFDLGKIQEAVATEEMKATPEEN